ncbi:hypothetical protein SAMN05216232_1980 [Virgibacillus subterraneus]|uniref:Uncharacterized protein n=1 Tax=Virgibacillus subterraneus TaxID=621109 RepID=A0A1H9ECA4_9BACI|nr:hypothetical protein [Virgibacillus subterraneus]SEQ23340.1 hypothetical protein SAMN05216232_1980 [Virgibacillus subterraneus]
MKPNLQEYLKQNQEKGIFHHVLSATDNSDNVLIYIHPSDADGETLDFEVKENELTQLHVSEEDDVRKVVNNIIDGLSLEELKRLANRFGLNY